MYYSYVDQDRSMISVIAFSTLSAMNVGRLAGAPSTSRNTPVRTNADDQPNLFAPSISEAGLSPIIHTSSGATVTFASLVASRKIRWSKSLAYSYVDSSGLPKVTALNGALLVTCCISKYLWNAPCIKPPKQYGSHPGRDAERQSCFPTLELATQTRRTQITVRKVDRHG